MHGLFYVGMRYINWFAVYIRSAAVGCYHAGDALYERRFTRSIERVFTLHGPTYFEGVLEVLQLSVYV